MLNFLRREYARLLTSGAQLLLLLLGIYLHSRTTWLVCLSATALISVFAWLSDLSRWRAVRNTPTSKIASAAQGYVELIGRGQPYSDTPLLSNLSRRPCLWCRYKVEQRGTKNEWEHVDSGESVNSFVICDDTGECVVDPEQAEISTQHYQQWVEDNYRYTEWRLHLQDEIYVIGQFCTESGSTAAFDTRLELGNLLAEWKKDKPRLLARFDLNQDGELSMEEWALATQAAKREVDKMRTEVQSRPGMNCMNRPLNGKPYLVSNLPQKNLLRRYLFWSWAHLVIFFSALAAIGWVLQIGHQARIERPPREAGAGLFISQAK